MKSISQRRVMFKFGMIMILVTLLLMGLEVILLEDYKSNIINHNEELIKHYEEKYNAIIAGYGMVAKTYFDEIINKNNIIKIIEKSNNSDDDVKIILRKKLFKIMEATYEKANENELGRFNFILKDNTSFLRLYDLNLYGDSLKENRPTIKRTSDTKYYTEGFEIGKTCNGYRFVNPLYNEENDYIGCVESSVSCVTIMKLMDELFSNPSTIIMKKSSIDRNLGSIQIDKNYRESRISKFYYYDKNAFEYTISRDVNKQMIKNLTEEKKLMPLVADLLKKEETFVINLDKNNRSYSMVFLKIEDVVGEHMGYLIFYYDNQIFAHLKNSIIIKSIFVAVLWIFAIVTSRILYSSKIQTNRLTYFDKLTCVYNRNNLYKAIHNQMFYSDKNDQNLSLIIYDVDYFKKINDEYGHLVGDDVLKEITNLVKLNIRERDYLFRFGGDEFIILLPKTNLNDAKIIAEEIRYSISNQFYFSKNVKNVTLSMGVTEYRGNESLEMIISRADRALYTAKEMGRNKVVES